MVEVFRNRKIFEEFFSPVKLLVVKIYGIPAMAVYPGSRAATIKHFYISWNVRNLWNNSKSIKIRLRTLEKSRRSRHYCWSQREEADFFLRNSEKYRLRNPNRMLAFLHNSYFVLVYSRKNGKGQFRKNKKYIVKT